MAQDFDAVSAKLSPAFPSSATPSQTSAPAIVAPMAGLLASVKLLDLAPGLYAITIDPAPAQAVSLGGLSLPATMVTPIGGDPGQPAEIFGSDPAGNWVGPGGGTVVVRIPAGGGQSLITTYRSEQQDAIPLSIKIAAIGRAAPSAAAAVTAAQHTNGTAHEASTQAGESTLPAQITFCIDEESGQAAAGEWAGVPGTKRFVEAFGITPQGHLGIDDIEYKGFGPNGRATPWVSSGKLCGSRGKKIALTGFAIRPAPHLREKIDIIYAGAFADSGRTSPCRNGEPCRAASGDDPLEALSLRIVARA